MSLFGALNTGVTALTAFSNSIATISTNIANINTPGYKSFQSQLSTLIAGGSKLAAGGGVLDIEKQNISQQGVLQATNNSTDLAISGNGFFVIATDNSGTISDFEYTRNGAFQLDEEGNFVNSNGQNLLGWPLDSNGNKPGEGDNTNTTPSQLLTSLVSVNLLNVVGSANPTTTVTASYNLDSTTTAFLGQTDALALASSTNQNNDSDDLIIPQSFSSGATFTATSSSGTASTFTYTIANSNDISSTILGVNDADTTFSTPNDGDDFTITVGGTQTFTFDFQSSNPSSSNGEFSNFTNLATAINDTDQLRARIVSGVMYVADEDGAAVTFASGTSGGADILAGLGFSNIAAGFNSLDNLESLVDADSSEEFFGSFSSSGVLSLGVVDPTATVTFTVSDTDLATELGLDTTGALGPSYAAGTAATNMASGNVTPDFSSAIQVFDAQGTAHNLLLSFLKIDDNEWAIELYASDATEVSGVSNGQVASGTAEFDGTGALADIDGFSSVSITWTNGAANSTIALSLTGTTQVAGPFVTNEIDQNGLAVGDLASSEVTKEGFVKAFFSNGTSRDLFKLPTALFPNPDGLEAQSGGSFIPTDDSGTVVLEDAGERGAGTIQESTLEGSTSDVASEFTKIIVSQRAYQSSARVITTADELLQELTNIGR